MAPNLFENFLQLSLYCPYSPWKWSEYCFEKTIIWEVQALDFEEKKKYNTLLKWRLYRRLTQKNGEEGGH